MFSLNVTPLFAYSYHFRYEILSTSVLVSSSPSPIFAVFALLIVFGYPGLSAVFHHLEISYTEDGEMVDEIVENVTEKNHQEYSYK